MATATGVGKVVVYKKETTFGEIESESNVLNLCRRPQIIVRATKNATV